MPAPALKPSSELWSTLLPSVVAGRVDGELYATKSDESLALLCSGERGRGTEASGPMDGVEGSR